MKRPGLFERDDIIWSGNSVFEQSAPFCPGSMDLNMMGDDAGGTIYSQCRQKHGRGGWGFSSVSFKFEPEDKAVTDSFCTLVGGRSRDINYNIAQFLNMIASTIVVKGRFVYELQIGRNKESQEIVKMNFSPVSAPDSKMFVFGRHVIQLLPSSIAREYSCSRVRTLDTDYTFIFQAPSRWRHALRKARSGLRFYDAMRYRLMDEVAESMKSNRRVKYTCNDASNLKLLAGATASLGWSGRGLFQGYQTDYLAVEWRLRWNSFCVDLRNGMIHELERAVCRIADIRKSDCRLIVQESSEYSLDDVRKELYDGKTSTVELVKRLF